MITLTPEGNRTMEQCRMVLLPHNNLLWVLFFKPFLRFPGVPYLDDPFHAQLHVMLPGEDKFFMSVLRT